MEIEFITKTLNTYGEIVRQSKRIQDTAECVVPDTQDDAAEVADVEGWVFLKSKDITPAGVEINADVNILALYINEKRDKVCSVRMTKSVHLLYELTDISPDCRAVIALSVSGVEARALNPRKLSAAFELTGELSCYLPEQINSETEISEEHRPLIHCKNESAEACAINAVCEKTFVINDQFAIPSGKPAAEKICGCTAEFTVYDTQLIGTRLIAKGNVNVKLRYYSAEVDYPVTTEFVQPFSQIIDTGCEKTDITTVRIELSGAYYELADSISSERVLNVELHAVMQLVSREKTEIKYLSDAYSNLMNCNCIMRPRRLKQTEPAQKLKLSADERIELMPDCADVISADVRCERIGTDGENVRAFISVNVIYRDKAGLLGVTHRLLELKTAQPCKQLQFLSKRLTDVFIRPELPALNVRISMELEYIISRTLELEELERVELDEEKPYEKNTFAGVYLVRAENETLWELAKKYHSSVEKIRELNDTEDYQGKMLIIAKTK